MAAQEQSLGTRSREDRVDHSEPDPRWRSVQSPAHSIRGQDAGWDSVHRGRAQGESISSCGVQGDFCFHICIHVYHQSD